MITSVHIKWQASSSALGFSDGFFFSVNNSYDYEEKNCYFLSLSSVAQIKKKSCCKLHDWGDSLLSNNLIHDKT